MVAIGLWLILNDRFFLWPPQMAEFANDDLFGGVFVVIGTGILLWVFDLQRSARWNKWLLVAASFVFMFLTVYQFMIWIATGHYMSWISNAIITALVYVVTRRSDRRNG